MKINSVSITFSNQCLTKNKKINFLIMKKIKGPEFPLVCLRLWETIFQPYPIRLGETDPPRPIGSVKLFV